MLLAPGTRLVVLTVLMGGLAQPSLADSTPAKAPQVKSLSSSAAVLVKNDADKNKAGTNRRARGPALSERKSAGGCAKSKPASGDADFSFQGYNDAGIRC